MSYGIETVNFRTEAKAQIAAAREAGHDPWEIYSGHLGIARAIKQLLDEGN